MDTPARVLIASRSADKLREIREILAPLRRTELLSLADAGIGPSSDEDGIEAFDTFRENALAKAHYFARRAGLPVLADDSGIEVDALAGAPGVRSRRFSGRDDLGGRDLDLANNTLLLDRLQGLPSDRRGARYVCAAVFVAPGKIVLTAVGTCAGTILDAARGTRGFGYDPLFLPEGDTCTFAEMDAAVKHRFSHRARAFRALANAL
jgi:XTP/dITP diphosphohydrolase